MHRRSLTLVLAAGLVAAVAAACGSSASPGASSSPASSPAASGTAATGAAAAAKLAASLPTTVNGVKLQATAMTGTQLAGQPGFAELVQGLNNLFKTPDDLVAAKATDPTGASDLQIMALQLVGEDAGRLGLWMSNWTASLTGANVTQTNLGKPVTMVTQPGKAPIYYYVKGDTVYMVQTADKAMAQAALTALP